MGKYIIAGLKTEYTPRFSLLEERSAPYKADFPDEETEIKIRLTDEFLDLQKKTFPALTLEEHEYTWVGEGFYNEVLLHGGIVLHSSCVEKDGKAYLFSAKSGTGKSTHTHLWLEELENTQIINDDKPLLIKKDGIFCACGTPFSGKTDENIDACVPVRAIIFLHRNKENTLSRLKPSQSVPLFMAQTVNPHIREYADEMLTRTDEIITEIPVFSLGCNKNEGTGRWSYEAIEREINNEN